MKMKDKMIDFIMKPLNLMVRKQEHSFYFVPGTASAKNYEDYLNCSGNNCLLVLNSMINCKFKEKTYIYAEYYLKDRMNEYENLSKKARDNNIELIFVDQSSTDCGFIGKLKKKISKYINLYKAKCWITGTGDYYLFGKLKSQSVVCLNYFTSCKNDLIVGDYYRWSFIDTLITTSLLHSTASSAQMGVKLDHCMSLGFARNDTLFKSNKKSEIMRWIEGEIGYIPNKIIVYAPTYRDYEIGIENKARNLFGYRMDNLCKLLSENESVMICKLHNLQTRNILNYPSGVIRFKYCYDFSFYDLLSITDCLITDYSSVGYDYLMLDRPLIYNLYDYDYYEKNRGVSYEPYSEFCPGVIVKNADEMTSALMDLFSNKDEYENKRKHLDILFHKYNDSNSTDRIVKFLCEKQASEIQNEEI